MMKIHAQLLILLHREQSLGQLLHQRPYLDAPNVQREGRSFTRSWRRNIKLWRLRKVSGRQEQRKRLKQL
nr:hypothetical protein Iba_scaffold1681521CG0010 [Ipomoea batatas]